VNTAIGGRAGFLEFELPVLPAGHSITEVTLRMTYAPEGQNPPGRTDHFNEVGGVNMANWPPANVNTVDDLTWNVAIGPAPDTPDVLIEGGFDKLLGNPPNQLNFGGYDTGDPATATLINWNPNIVVPFDDPWGPLPYSLREPLVQNYDSTESGNTLLQYIQDNISDTTQETVILTLGPAHTAPLPDGENLTQWYSHLNEAVTCCMIDGDGLAVPFEEPLPAAPPMLFITTTGGSSFTDFDNSGVWEANDLNLVLFNWDKDGADLPADWVNQRPDAGTAVGAAELNKVLFNWDQPGLLATVPEPATCVLAVLAALLVALHRRSC